MTHDLDQELPTVRSTGGGVEENEIVTLVFCVTTVTIMGAASARGQSLTLFPFLRDGFRRETPGRFRSSPGYGLHRPGTNKVFRDTRTVQCFPRPAWIPPLLWPYRTFLISLARVHLSRGAPEVILILS